MEVLIHKHETELQKLRSKEQYASLSPVVGEHENFFNLNQLQHLIKVNHEVLRKKIKTILNINNNMGNIIENSEIHGKSASEAKSAFENYKIQVINSNSKDPSSNNPSS